MVDLDGTLPVEVKYRNQISKRDSKPLLKFMRKLGVDNGIVVTKDLLEKKSFEEGSVLFIPAWLFLLLERV